MDPASNFSGFEHSFKMQSKRFECMVCLESFLLGREKVSVLLCGHSIGNLCAKEIISKSCPVCQHKISHEVSQISPNFSLQDVVDNAIYDLGKQFLTGVLPASSGDQFSQLEGSALYEGIQMATDQDAVEFVFKRWLASKHTLNQSCGKGMTFLHRAICDANIAVLSALSHLPGIDALWMTEDGNGQTPQQLLALKVQKSQELWAFFHSKSHFPRIQVSAEFKGKVSVFSPSAPTLRAQSMALEPSVPQNSDSYDIKTISGREWFDSCLRNVSDLAALQSEIANWLRAGRNLEENFGSGNTLIHKALICGNFRIISALASVDEEYLLPCLSLSNSEGVTVPAIVKASKEIPADVQSFLKGLGEKKEKTDRLKGLFSLQEKYKIRIELQRLDSKTAFTARMDQNGNTLLHMAILSGNVLLIEVLGSDYAEQINLQQANDHGATPKQLAARSKVNGLVEAFMKSFYKMEYLWAHAEKYPYFAQLPKDKRMEQIKKMKREGDLNKLDREGFNFLHRATFKGDVEIVKQLLAEGADPSCRSTYGFTPMSYYIFGKNTKSSLSIIDLLVKHGADPLAKVPFPNPKDPLPH